MEVKKPEKIGNHRVYYSEYGIGFVPLDNITFEKTAKEMFEELGFEIDDIKKTYLSYYNKEEDSYIYFDYIYKTVEVQFDINMDLLKAINKQVEELGWNNE